MKIIVQRVKKASVEVENVITGQIEHGLLLFLGIHASDTEEQIEWLSDKVAKLRIFEDEEGKMNLSVRETGGSILLISQFTLYGDVKKGTRPSFIEAARPEKAIPLYEKMIATLREKGLAVETGIFGADMQVSLVNDGPVTIILEK